PHVRARLGQPRVRRHRGRRAQARAIRPERSHRAHGERRRGMSVRLSLLAAALVCLAPMPSRADCDLARFGASATGACSRASADCVPAYLPEEIRAIVRGPVLETIGLAVNDGRASWRALDIERREVVVVERY